MNVTEYRVASGSSGLAEFTEFINNMIKEGYQPLGGISVVFLGSSYAQLKYTQVMVKYV